MKESIDKYLREGCGRCPKGGTPDCKVLQWVEELTFLRELLAQTELKESIKWGVPVFTLEGKNVLSISALNNYCALSFFKGTLLKDKLQLLVKPGEDSQAVAMFKFSTLEDVLAAEIVIGEYIVEAINLERSGAKVQFQRSAGEMPEELLEVFARNGVLEAAFMSLTVGRQRGYNLYFSKAKQSTTRVKRIEKYIPKILSGKGFHD